MPIKLPRFIEDRVVRKKAPLNKVSLDRYQVRVARSLAEYEDAFRLLHIAYVFQGLESVRGVEMRITPQHVLPESTVLVAYDGEAIVGTMTVTLDSPAGLPLEKDYLEPLEGMRAEGHRLVESGSLAVVRRCWHTGVTTLMNMAAVWISRNTLDASHLVMGVNPKAGAFYRSVFAFSPIGEPRHHAELEAPVQGMQVPLDTLEAHLRRTATGRLADGGTIADAFFSRPPACIEVPEGRTLEELTRWKLSRKVFQDIFIRQSDRLDSLDPRTRAYLEQLRSPSTLMEQGDAQLRRSLFGDGDEDEEETPIPGDFFEMAG